VDQFVLDQLVLYLYNLELKYKLRETEDVTLKNELAKSKR